jgi:hypothetical protein
VITLVQVRSHGMTEMLPQLFLPFGGRKYRLSRCCVIMIGDFTMADFQYILPGAVGLPWGSNPYLWNPHIICSRTSMCNGHQSSVRGVVRVPGVEVAVALQGDSRELSYRPRGLLWRDRSF